MQSEFSGVIIPGSVLILESGLRPAVRRLEAESHFEPCLCRSRLPHDGVGEACARGVHEDVVGTCSTRDAKWPRVALKLVGACFSDFSGALVLWLSLLRPHPRAGWATCRGLSR